VRTKTPFRQMDVSRAIRAARIGGMDVASVVIDGAGNITVNARSEMRQSDKRECADADTIRDNADAQ
jgi:hypothetical protein